MARAGPRSSTEVPIEGVTEDIVATEVCGHVEDDAPARVHPVEHARDTRHVHFAEPECCEDNGADANADDDTDDKDDAPLLKKHTGSNVGGRAPVNIWWAAGALVSVWFTALRGLPMLLQPIPLGPMIIAHLVLASLVSWLCIMNLAVTPSLGPICRFVHVWCGRAAMVAGLIGVVCGFYSIWIERFRRELVGFAIGISVGGVFQLQAQLAGWRAVRNREMHSHIHNMHMVFFGGCLVPAVMRLPQLLGFADSNTWQMFCWIVPVWAGLLASRARHKGTWW